MYEEVAYVMYKQRVKGEENVHDPLMSFHAF